MAKLAITKGTTDVTVYLFIQDSSVTTGAGLTGLVYNSASLVAYYVRPLGSATAITLATQTVTGAHSDGGFVEVSSANMPGIYRLDLPDAVCASGVNSAVVMLKGATNMAPVALEVQLTSYDPNDAVRMGLTALPNAAADAAGGLPISDAGGLDMDNIGADTDTLLTRLSAARAGYLDNINNAALATTAAQTGDSFARIGATGSGLTSLAQASAYTATRAGYLDNINNAALQTTVAQTGDSFARIGATGSGLTSLAAAATALSNATWTDARAGYLDNINNTALSSLTAPIRTGTAQAGAATTITLDAGASATDNFYRGLMVLITGNTGAGQARMITAYTGSTKVATVAAWATNPDNTSTFALLPWGNIRIANAIGTGGITTASFAAGAIDAAAIAADAIGASELAADAVTEIQNGLATAAALATAQTDLDTLTGTDGVTLATSQPNYAPNTTTPPTAAAIADQVWDETMADHLGAGSTGAALNAAGSAGDPWTTTLPGSYTGSQAGKMLSDIITDTNELQGDWVNAGRLDAILDTIAADVVNLDGAAMRGTDSAATATALATAQADLDTITGTDGVTLATLQANYAPATAASLATAQTDLDTITGSDGVTLATTQANYAPATAASVAALNDLSAAQVNAEVVDVLRTDTIPDSYAADGAQPTIAQAILAINQFLMERAVSSTTVTVKKPDGSTTAMTLTLNDATTPTSITRAS